MDEINLPNPAEHQLAALKKLSHEQIYEVLMDILQKLDLSHITEMPDAGKNVYFHVARKNLLRLIGIEYDTYKCLYCKNLEVPEIYQDPRGG